LLYPLTQPAALPIFFFFFFGKGKKNAAGIFNLQEGVSPNKTKTLFPNFDK